MGTHSTKAKLHVPLETSICGFAIRLVHKCLHSIWIFLRCDFSMEKQGRQSLKNDDFLREKFSKAKVTVCAHALAVITL